MPMVSIIVPVYKTEKYLYQCVESLVKQTFQDIEIILVDDGSPDSCGQLCDEFAKHYSSVRVIHQNNQGVGAARNTGIHAALGKWLMFVDSDDWVEPDIVECLLREVKLTDADICICQYIEEKNGQSILRDNNITKILEATHPESPIEIILKGLPCVTPWAKLYKAKLISDYGIKFNDLRIGEDAIYNLYCFQSADKLCCCKKALYHYRIHPEGAISGPRPHYMEECSHFLEKVHDFAVQYPNGGLSMHYYYREAINSLIWLQAFFANDLCKLSDVEKISLLKKLLSVEPYKSAAKKVKLSGRIWKYKLLVLPLRLRLIHVFYWMCRLRHIRKSKLGRL